MDEGTDNMLDAKLANSVAALLKLEPLIEIDPNDQISLLKLVEQAHQIAFDYKFNNTGPEILKKLALAINRLGADFANLTWVARILSEGEQDEQARADELFLYMAYQKIGPDSIDFSAYTILKFKRQYPESEYRNEDIHVASQMALKIAREHNINDLLNTYSCVEIILFTTVDFTRDPVCAPLKGVFENNQLSSDEKIAQSFAWLSENLVRIIEEIKDRTGV